MTTTSQKGFKIGPPMPDIEGGSKIPQALNNPVPFNYLSVWNSARNMQKWHPEIWRLPQSLDVTTERQIHMPLAEIPMSSLPRPQNAYFGNNSVGLNGPGWMMQAH